MEFLADLKRNNDREWFKMHDPDYRQSWNDWSAFVEALTEKITEVDETIPDLPPKDLVFRIYRDVRFSKDQTPYKPHYSAAWSRTGTERSVRVLLCSDHARRQKFYWSRSLDARCPAVGPGTTRDSP